MVRVIGPALSLDAAKSLGKKVTFRGDRQRTILSRFQKPGGRAPFVLGYYPYMARVYTSEAVRKWHLLSPSERQEWNDYIKS